MNIIGKALINPASSLLERISGKIGESSSKSLETLHAKEQAQGFRKLKESMADTDLTKGLLNYEDKCKCLQNDFEEAIDSVFKPFREGNIKQWERQMQRQGYETEIAVKGKAEARRYAEGVIDRFDSPEPVMVRALNIYQEPPAPGKLPTVNGFAVNVRKEPPGQQRSPGVTLAATEHAERRSPEFDNLLEYSRKDPEHRLTDESMTRFLNDLTHTGHDWRGLE